MAAEDPEAFEKYREILLKKAMEDSRQQIQQRLEDMQHRIDRERDATDASIGSCVRIFDLMVDYFYAEYLPGVYMKMPVKMGKKITVAR